MSRKVSIIMYHYVRDLKRSRYPEIKGLAASGFKGQLAYILKHYKIITAEELIHTATSGSPLPLNALLLTFDDGFIDHFTCVFPLLDEKRIQGCFFPSVKPIVEHRVLDVHKIHFILAAVRDKLKIVGDIFQMLDKNKSTYQLKDKRHYYGTLAVDGRYDTKDVVFIKQILQRELPRDLRAEMTDVLFRKHVTEDEKAFSMELYMSADQLKCMQRSGMYIGSHGYDHYWLGTLNKEDQRKEIDLSVKFLKKMGSSTENWVMCYPYGNYNRALLKLLKERGCAVGLSTEVGIADLDCNYPLALPRLDTNDLPMTARSATNKWTGLHLNR